MTPLLRRRSTLSLLCLAVLAAVLQSSVAAALPPPGDRPIQGSRLRPIAKGQQVTRPDLRNLPPGNRPVRPGLVRRGPNGALIPIAPGRGAERLTRLVERNNLGERMKAVNAVHERQARANARRHEVMESLLARAHGRPLRPMPEELRMELVKHARRNALLARASLLAMTEKDEKSVAKATTLQEAEAARHERRLTVLFGDPANAPPEQQEAARVKKAAETPAAENPDAPAPAAPKEEAPADTATKEAQP